MRVRVIEKQAHIIFRVVQGSRTKKRLVKSVVSDRHALCSFSATDNMYVRTYANSHMYGHTYHCDILASYLGNNCEPWSLYGGLSCKDVEKYERNRLRKSL